MEVAADLLTLSRGLLAVGLVVILASGQLGLAAVALSLAWVTDVLDGRLARAAPQRTRLGAWDFAADVAVGAGVLVGLALEGYAPRPLAAALLLILAGGFVLLRNVALGMALQAVAYAGLLWHLWVERVGTWWLPVLVGGTIGVLERRRLVKEEIPTFVRGLGRALLLRRGTSLRFPGDEDGPGGPTR